MDNTVAEADSNGAISLGRFGFHIPVETSCIFAFSCVLF